MSTVEVDSQTVYYLSHQQVYHTDPDCSSVQSAKKEVLTASAASMPLRRLCKRCAGECQYVGKPWANGQCRHCGDMLEDGECDFCARFDAVHDRPADEAVAAAAQQPPVVMDDRVVAAREPCRQCAARAAGADGLCSPCRMKFNGDIAGNGRRL